MHAHLPLRTHAAPRYIETHDNYDLYHGAHGPPRKGTANSISTAAAHISGQRS